MRRIPTGCRSCTAACKGIPARFTAETEKALRIGEHRKGRRPVTVEGCVCDFISGMTDRYAIETYEELFVPRVWRGLHE